MLNTCLRNCLIHNKNIIHNYSCYAAVSQEQAFWGVVGGKWLEEEHKNKWGMQEDSSTGPAGLTLLKSAGLHLKADFLTSIKNSLTKAKFWGFCILRKWEKDADNYVLATVFSLEHNFMLSIPFIHLFMSLIQERVRWPHLPSNTFQHLLGSSDSHRHVSG